MHCLWCEGGKMHGLQITCAFSSNIHWNSAGILHIKGIIMVIWPKRHCSHHMNSLVSHSFIVIPRQLDVDHARMRKLCQSPPPPIPSIRHVPQITALPSVALGIRLWIWWNAAIVWYLLVAIVASSNSFFYHCVCFECIWKYLNCWMVERLNE